MWVDYPLLLARESCPLPLARHWPPARYSAGAKPPEYPGLLSILPLGGSRPRSGRVFQAPSAQPADRLGNVAPAFPAPLLPQRSPCLEVELGVSEPKRQILRTLPEIPPPASSVLAPSAYPPLAGNQPPTCRTPPGAQVHPHSLSSGRL